jgi:VanZ family protein
LTIAFLKNRDLWLYWLPPLAWCGLVLLLSGDLGSALNTGKILKWLLSWFPPLSPEQFNLFHFYVRKTIGHFGNYAILYFLWIRAFRGQMGCGPGRAFLWAIAACLAVALLDEGHQTLVQSRSGSLRDVGLDLTGASASALVTWVFGIPRG